MHCIRFHPGVTLRFHFRTTWLFEGLELFACCLCVWPNGLGLVNPTHAPLRTYLRMRLHLPFVCKLFWCCIFFIYVVTVLCAFTCKMINQCCSIGFCCCCCCYLVLILFCCCCCYFFAAKNYFVATDILYSLIFFVVIFVIIVCFY